MTNAINVAALGSTGVSPGFKNRIINGAMVIDQRNAGASVTPTGSGYGLDRWGFIMTQSSKFSYQQNAGAITGPVGFTSYLGITSASAYSVATGDTFLFQQWIEGFNSSDLNWGTADAKTVTLSFWVRSSLTGTFGGAVCNYNSNATNYSYPFSYSISVANTWTQISVTIAGPTAGTWVGATNNGNIGVRFGLGSGATFSGTAGAWASGNYVQPTGTTSVVGTSGATFYITGVQLEVGSTATGFDYRAYGQELALCQRYYEIFTGNANGTSLLSSPLNEFTNCWLQIFYKQTKRATPTVTALVGWTLGGGTTPLIHPSIDNCAFSSSNYFYLNTSGPIMSISAEL